MSQLALPPLGSPERQPSPEIGAESSVSGSVGLAALAEVDCEHVGAEVATGVHANRGGSSSGSRWNTDNSLDTRKVGATMNLIELIGRRDKMDLGRRWTTNSLDVRGGQQWAPPRPGLLSSIERSKLDAEDASSSNMRRPSPKTDPEPKRDTSSNPPSRPCPAASSTANAQLCRDLVLEAITTSIGRLSGLPCVFSAASEQAARPQDDGSDVASDRPSYGDELSSFLSVTPEPVANQERRSASPVDDERDLLESRCELDVLAPCEYLMVPDLISMRSLSVSPETGLTERCCAPAGVTCHTCGKTLIPGSYELQCQCCGLWTCRSCECASYAVGAFRADGHVVCSCAAESSCDVFSGTGRALVQPPAACSLTSDLCPYEWDEFRRGLTSNQDAMPSSPSRPTRPSSPSSRGRPLSASLVRKPVNDVGNASVVESSGMSGVPRPPPKPPLIPGTKPKLFASMPSVPSIVSCSLWDLEFDILDSYGDDEVCAVLCRGPSSSTEDDVDDEHSHRRYAAPDMFDSPPADMFERQRSISSPTEQEPPLPEAQPPLQHLAQEPPEQQHPWQHAQFELPQPPPGRPPTSASPIVRSRHLVQRTAAGSAAAEEGFQRQSEDPVNDGSRIAEKRDEMGSSQNALPVIVKFVDEHLGRAARELDYGAMDNRS